MDPLEPQELSMGSLIGAPQLDLDVEAVFAVLVVGHAFEDYRLRAPGDPTTR